MMLSKSDQLGKKKRVNRGGLTPKTFHNECQKKEIYYCEVCKYEIENNIHTNKARRSGWSVLDPAHRHERNDYKNGFEHILWHLNQVIRCCRNHHNIIDVDKEYREQIFLSLRGEDLLCKN